jgi:hypothetical protein
MGGEKLDLHRARVAKIIFTLLQEIARFLQSAAKPKAYPR